MRQLLGCCPVGLVLLRKSRENAIKGDAAICDAHLERRHPLQGANQDGIKGTSHGRQERSPLTV